MNSLPPTIDVSSRPPEVDVGPVTVGETWHFEAHGDWIDGFIHCGPDGYRFPLAEFLDIWPRLHSAPWFALVGFVGTEAFMIGTGIDHTFQCSGKLVVCANDLSGMRWNNRGAVKLTAERIAAPPPSLPPAQPAQHPPGSGGLLSAWVDLVNMAQKTKAFLFIAVLLLLTGGILAFSDQGKDLITAVVENGTDPGAVGYSFQLDALFITAAIFGLQAWFWARAIVEFQFGDRENWRERRFLMWMPRAFGILPFVFLLFAFHDSGNTLTAPGGILIASGIIIFVFVICREALARSLYGFAKSLHDTDHHRFARVLESTLFSLKSVILGSGVIAAVLLMISVILRPVTLATHVGPAAVVFGASALIIPPMVLLIQMGALYRIPVVPAMVALACVFSLWNDNHAIRLTPNAPVERPNLATAWQSWRRQAAPVRGSIPVIFVAAEGGASRAGYWTGDALSVLEQRTRGEFSKHLFMISSISGSSLGTAAFVATLRDNPGLVKTGKLRNAIDDFVGRDYLSPTLAGMLFPDLLQRFLPFGFLPDRAKYTELSWEAGWTAHCEDEKGRCTDDHLFEKPYLSIWSAPSAGWIPVLAVGGAREEDGRRILTSSVLFHSNEIDADDFHVLTNRDVRISTAMLNGARFPVVSPGGTFPPEAGGHLLDGGYFDTAGIEMMREVASVTLAPGLNVRAPQDNSQLPLRPIFILLENGAPSDSPPKPVANAMTSRSVARHQIAQHGSTRTPGLPDDQTPARTDQFAADALGPLAGLLSSRDAHAAHLRVLLEQMSQSLPACSLPSGCGQNAAPIAPELIEIRVCNKPDSIRFPLDWILSEKVKREMSAEMDNAANAQAKCDNSTPLARIDKLLGR